jgi:hypothetical protein
VPEAKVKEILEIKETSFQFWVFAAVRYLAIK